MTCFFAQTCNSLRDVVLAHKSSIYHTHNCYTLQLPLGTTLDDMSPESVYAIAARSVAVSARLSTGQMPLRFRESVFYDLASLEVPTYCSTLFIRRNLFVFRTVPCLIALRLGNAGVIENCAGFLIPGSDISIEFQLLDEDTLLVAWMESKSDSARVVVRDLCINNVQFGAITRHLDIEVLGDEWQYVVIRDPYIAVVHDCGQLLILDWRLKTGIVLDVLETAWGTSSLLEMPPTTRCLTVSL